MTRTAQRHWFYLVLPALFAAALGFRATHGWARQPGLGEAITILDWCVFVPLLHALCYRDMPIRSLALRTLAMMCGGIWIAGRIVPDPAEHMLIGLGSLRMVGIAALIVFEVLASLAMLRIVFGAALDPGALERQGIPPTVVRLMLAEARFWSWLWARLRDR